MLDLIHPMYRETASYGHFGREPVEMEYDWQDDVRRQRPPAGPVHGFQLGTDGPGGGSEEGCRPSDETGGDSPF